MNIQKSLALILALATSLLVSSCLENETNITVNNDGSGTITEETVFNAEVMEFIDMAAQQGGQGNNPLDELKNVEKAKAKAAAYGEGVTFTKVEEIARNGGKGIRITYKFEDINKLTFNPGNGLADMAGGGAGTTDESTEVKFAFADNQLTIISPEMDAEKAKQATDEIEVPDVKDPQSEMAMQMLKGMKITAKVTIAPGIAKTDASYHEDNVVTLYEMNLDEILTNPEGLKAMKGIDMSDRTKAAAALAKIKGVKAETKEKVLVELK